MAAMTTVLTEFSNNGNSRTSTLNGHTAVKPRIVIEKRKVPDGNQTMAEYSAKIIYATADADGAVLGNKVSFEVIVRYPVLGNTADVTAARAILADIVSGNEFASSVGTLGWLG